ncbi:MAG TPA: Crp/Fnr family transcriptional regulator [Anaerolineales bacterium]|nr:Crp/Fnr family transcriptional regulator [Anaerolineales bacterium]
MQDLVTLLDHADVLGKFTTSEKQKLASLAVRRALKRGESLYWQGDLWTNVFFIATGRLQSVINSLDGRSFVVFTWEAGNDFWGHSLFDGEPMPSTMEAVQDSVIYVWEGEDVLRTLFGNPGAIRALLRRETQMIRKRRDTISELAFQPVTGRLAKLLLERIPASETSTERDLTLDQIAAMVASSPEVVCRTLYQFQRGGLLRVTRASIDLHDRVGLERLAGIE